MHMTNLLGSETGLQVVQEDYAALAMAAVRVIFPVLPALQNRSETMASDISTGKFVGDVPPG